MKFFANTKENLSVIDKITKKRIALFENGEFKTEDPKIIKKLKIKFRFEESPKSMSGLANFLKLKTEAMNKGIYKKGMKKKDIEKALKEFESKNKLKGDK